MAREMYETEEHLEKERQVIAVVESKWKCEAVKLPISYALDYALMRNGRIAAFAEIRCRNKRYDSYMLSLKKVLACLDLSRVTALPSMLIVSLPDPQQIVWARMTPQILGDFGFNGRNEMRDWQDKEPVAYIDMKEFTAL